MKQLLAWYFNVPDAYQSFVRDLFHFAGIAFMRSSAKEGNRDLLDPEYDAIRAIVARGVAEFVRKYVRSRSLDREAMLEILRDYPNLDDESLFELEYGVKELLSHQGAVDFVTYQDKPEATRQALCVAIMLLMRLICVESEEREMVLEEISDRIIMWALLNVAQGTQSFPSWCSIHEVEEASVRLGPDIIAIAMRILLSE